MDKTQGFNTSNKFDSAPGQPAEAGAKVLVGEVAQSARQVAGDLAGRARQAAEQQIGSVKQMAADRIGNVADALRATGDQLRSKDGDGVSHYVDQAVDRLDAASGYLQRSSLADLVADVEGLARRQPAIFFGGVFLFGIFAGRFFKSSGAIGGVEAGGPSSGGRGALSSHSEAQPGRGQQGSPDERTEFDRAIDEDDGPSLNGAD